uniref:ATP synthase subunit a n=1 Tax=Modiolus philippinarum TaxID=310899 RepID=A0A1Z2WWV0_9BIVA|nr:ATP synthase F0 subunit 6 [Modiolus philippinarum]ASB29971.1 ATP synthase F0 subunit 6 [Modiolus philippinarum]
MLDLLSSFDSFSMTKYSCGPLWVSGSTGLFLYLGSAWCLTSVWESLIMKMFSFCKSFMNDKSGEMISGFALTVTSVFMALVSLNLLGLVPYSYGLTCQSSVGPVLALYVWSCLIASGFRVSLVQSLSILVPSYSPVPMSPFLMLVELVAVCLRPLTLGLRLMINLIAGHMIICMLGQVNIFLFLLCSKSNSFVSSVALLLCSMSGTTTLFVVELAVGCLQSYIFCVLLSLYSDDHPL